jgi:hypothetical protein
MVGGKVIETIVLRDRVWINCRERKKELAIYVRRDAVSRSVSPGDTVWWQGRMAMWTPKGKPFADKRMERIGFSGVPRPSDTTEGL